MVRDRLAAEAGYLRDWNAADAEMLAKSDTFFRAAYGCHRVFQENDSV